MTVLSFPRIITNIIEKKKKKNIKKETVFILK